MKRNSHCLPDSTQELLLNACLSSPDQAVVSWKLWKAKTDIENLDFGSFRLLPLLYRNLQSAGIEAQMLRRYRSVYRYFWYKNRLYLHLLGEFLTQYNRAGADLPLLLKGIPLILNYYSDPGLRPMSDIDIMVPEKDLPVAFSLLEQNGLTADKRLPVRPSSLWLEVEKGCHFKNQSGIEVDLHWNLLPESNYLKDENSRYIQRGREVEVGAGKAKIPDATDLLYHVCAHGMKWNVVHPLRWIPDVMVILERDGERIDWDRVVSAVRRDRFTLRFKKAFEYLAVTGTTDRIPFRVKDLFARLEPGKWEIPEFWFLGHRMEILGDLPADLFLAYRHTLKNPGRKNRWMIFARFIGRKWRVKHFSQLLREIGVRLKRRLKAAIERTDSIHLSQNH